MGFVPPCPGGRIGSCREELPVAVLLTAGGPVRLLLVPADGDGLLELAAVAVGALAGLGVDPAGRAVVAPEVVTAALGLTPAESQIAVWLAEGKTVRNIALATGRSEGTVRWHVKHILRKHGLSR